MRRCAVLIALAFFMMGAAWTPLAPTPKCCWPWQVNNALLDAACQDDCVAAASCTANTWEEVTDAVCETRPNKSCVLVDNQTFNRRKYDCNEVECPLAGGDTGSRCTRGVVDTENVQAKKCSAFSDLCTSDPI